MLPIRIRIGCILICILPICIGGIGGIGSIGFIGSIGAIGSIGWKPDVVDVELLALADVLLP